MIRLRHNKKPVLPDGDNIIQKTDLFTKIPLTLAPLRSTKNCQKQPNLAPNNSESYKLSTVRTAHDFSIKLVTFLFIIFKIYQTKKKEFLQIKIIQ